MTKGKSTADGKRQTLLLSSNSLWNVENFRGHLVKEFHQGGWDVVIAAPATAEQRQFWSLPARIVPLRIARSGMNPFADLGLLWAYYKLMRSERPAAYLGWTIKPNLYGAITARAAGVPSILNVSGLGTGFLGGSLLNHFVSKLYKFAFSKALVVFFQNGDDLRLFESNRLIRKQQARLLPGSGIDLTHFSVAPTPPERPLRFVMVARLIGDKGLREFADAARIARLSLPDAKFQLVGPFDPDNRTSITPLELQDWITEGHIDYLGEATDIRPYLAAATAVVLPSYREGLPRSLLEGAAIGRPLIATDVPGCRELVEHGVNGFLCEVKSSLSLAQAMLKLAGLSVAERIQMGERSREIAEIRFSEELVTKAYVVALSSFKQTQ